MAFKPSHFAIVVALFGSMAFIFGVIAENKKPAAGTRIQGKDVAICKFPNDPTIVMGSLSVVALLISAFLGVVAVFYPYKGRSVPKEALFHSTALAIFFAVAIGITVLAEAMMMWATITEVLHHTRNVHHNPKTDCPTAKTGLFGGAAFLALDASLFWLICQMMTGNARADYLEDEDPKGTYGEVLATDHDANGAKHQGAPRGLNHRIRC